MVWFFHVLGLYVLSTLYVQEETFQQITPACTYWWLSARLLYHYTNALEILQSCTKLIPSVQCILSYIWTLVPEAGISNCIPQYSVGSNCSSLPDINASVTKVLICDLTSQPIQYPTEICMWSVYSILAFCTYYVLALWRSKSISWSWWSRTNISSWSEHAAYENHSCPCYSSRESITWVMAV